MGERLVRTDRYVIDLAFPGRCSECDELLTSDEHLAGCEYDSEAAKRLEQREGQWDSQGIRQP